MSEQDEIFMRAALAQAERAQALGEVPIGAVLVRDGQVVAEGWNHPIESHDPTAHAEIVALRAAGQVLQNYRLPGTTMYVTLEPCPMCIGAMIHARVSRIVFGAHDPKTGAAGGALDLLGDPTHNHRIEVIGGVLGEECGNRLREFFRQKRAVP
ncbi:MAG: tRNA adenosine(34) deaminase TadA [Gammaproteobacteria bacterium]|nr:tRNA adenosine(34) deaminase TadA [Gammaproteobacteria bacterium]MCP5135877.1 tRNA adenosine(34) deaminase TadA [Gammaproteobacteria bacterium]